jgi:hypothetical protein
MEAKFLGAWEDHRMDQRWIDPEAPWWAKLRRARVHINEVEDRVDALQSAGRWSIQREPAGADGWAYRFRLPQAIPADLSAVVADAVGNMRSALDNIAYELALHYVGEMNNDQKTATEFPICRTEAGFRRFFKEGKRGPVRDGLYGDLERRALMCVQPFALTDEGRALGVEPSTSRKDDLQSDHAYVLNALWNIDKHRRLPGLAWAAGPMWFSGDVSGCQWFAHVGELTPLQDGTVIG